MTSIAEGLTIGDEGAEVAPDDLSSNAAFMASLARDLAGTDQDIANGEPPAPPAPPVATGTSDGDDGDNSEADTGDEQIPDGYVPKQQYDELHSLVGRMGNELGDLRKKVESIPEPTVEETTYTPPTPITDELLEALDEQIERNGGEAMAVWALTSRPDLYETVLDQWSEVGGAQARKAAEFNMKYQSELAKYEAEEEAKSAQQFQATVAQDLDAQVIALAPSYGITPGTPEVDQLLAEILVEQPKEIKDLVVSRDAGQREAGLKVILQIAALRSAATPPSAEGGAGDALTAALAHAKGNAGVGQGSQSRSAPAAGTPDPPKGFDMDKFQEMLVSRPTTSVAEGLTFGT